MLTEKQKKYIKLWNALFVVMSIAFFVMVFTLSKIAGAICVIACLVMVIMPHVVDMDDHYY